MARPIGEHYEGDVRVRWFDDHGQITVERFQDAQNAVDIVAAVNAEGAPTIDGLGKPLVEIPLVAAMEWAERRGIPWEKFLYGNEYDDDYRRFVGEHQKLAYKPARRVHVI